MADLKATDSVRYTLNDGQYIDHEVYNGIDMFRHRLVALFQDTRFEGEWVVYQGFARLALLCGSCDTIHVYMATQDTWQPMFPPLFELRIPDADCSPEHTHGAFALFLDYGK